MGKNMSFKFKIIITITIGMIAALCDLLYVTFAIGENAVEKVTLETVVSEVSIAEKVVIDTYGELYYENGRLYSENGEDIYVTRELAEELKERLDSEFTIFVKSGNDFNRYITTLADKDGKTLEGTLLGTTHAAYKDVISGNLYTGNAVINGLPYITAYLPVTDSNDNVTALLFVGKEMSHVKEIIFAEIGKYIVIIIGGMTLMVLFMVFITIKIINKDLIKRIGRDLSTLEKTSSTIAGYADALSQSGTAFAQDSQEQASSIEEISSSIEETTSMIAQTSEGADKTFDLSDKSHDAIVEGNVHMNEMLENINEIKKSSDEIGKIIKIIDDIASQTNILALNAAVEAARAGDAGKGFAVVAEEVRSLAQKSAEAAKNTGAIIEKNIELSEKGVNVAEMVSQSLVKIEDAITKVQTIAKESADATSEEAKGMEQVSESMKVIEKSTMTTAENAQKNVEYSRLLQNEMNEIKKVMDELMEIIK